MIVNRVVAAKQRKAANPRESSQHRLAVMTNILTPYRLPIYRILAERFDTLVLIGKAEDNRRWDFSETDGRFQVKDVWGASVKRRVRSADGGTDDLRYTHINPGYFVELLRFRPHSIISTEMGIRSILAILYGQLFRVPVWIWWGGTLHTERHRSKSKQLLRKYGFARFVRRWISYGDSSSEYLRSLNIPQDRILQIQNCVDDTVFRKKTVPFVTNLPRPTVLCVGQLIGRKGIYQLIDAVSTLQREGVPVSLHFVGHGPEEHQLRAEARRLGLDHLQFSDYIPPERMPAVYRAADLLVFPTLEDVWGLVVNEALLAGTSVIASKYAGCASELLPASNIFNPLDQNNFVTTLRSAVQGQLNKPSASTLKSVDDVARILINDITQHVASDPGQLEPHADYLVGR